MKPERTNILLTGRPGIGKTTAIKEIANSLKKGLVAGFWSEEIRKEGKRVGFSIQTLSGKSGILAHVEINGPRVSKYGVNIQDIDSLIVPELTMAWKSERIIIIDEIARMELFSPKFISAVELCLKTGKVVATIQARNHPFIHRVKSRKDVRIMEITESNRDDIPRSVLDMLEKEFLDVS